MPTLKENFYKNGGLSIFAEGEGYDAGLAGEMQSKTYYNMFSPAKEKFIKKVSDFAKKTVAEGGSVTAMFSDGREYPLQKLTEPKALEMFTQEINKAIMNNDREAINDTMRVSFKIPNAPTKRLELKMAEFVKFAELYQGAI